eukprot:scaffold89249_cov35-Attheya_sp.AAC.2
MFDIITHDNEPAVNHVTTVGPLKNIFTAATPNITTAVREDSYIQHNRGTDDEVTVFPRANHVICEDTGKVLQYRALRQGKDKTVWTNGFCIEHKDGMTKREQILFFSSNVAKYHKVEKPHTSKLCVIYVPTKKKLTGSA